MLPFLPLIGTALSGVMSLFGQKSANDTSQSMAADRYQVASADMQKAGLNPAMMFSSGSAAAMPQVQSTTAGAASAIQQGISSAIQAKSVDAQVKQAEQNIAASKVSAALDASKIPTQNATTENIKADTVNTLLKQGITAADVTTHQDEAIVARNRAKTARNQLDMPDWMRKLMDQAGFAGQAAGDVLGPLSSSAKALAPLF